MAAAGQFRYCTSAHIGPAQLCLQAVSRQGAERNGRPRRLQQFHLSMQDCTGEARQVQLPARDTAAAADACPLLPPARCCCCTSPGSSLLTFCMAARLLGSGAKQLPRAGRRRRGCGWHGHRRACGEGARCTLLFAGWRGRRAAAEHPRPGAEREAGGSPETRHGPHRRAVRLVTQLVFLLRAPPPLFLRSLPLIPRIVHQ